MASKAKHLAMQAKQMFGTYSPTAEQMAYLLDMQRPSTYMLRNHTIKGNPMTFHVSGRDKSRALAHRPWQVDIINSEHPNLAVIKSRQLGLKFSPAT